jgi:serine/threonine protein kinase
MSDPRIPEDAIRAAIPGIDELEFIDRGGQGDAWRLRRNGGGDEVVKVIVVGDLARVDREIATMQALEDSRVMRFTEAGTLTHMGGQHPFIIGEYVPGGSIGSRLADGDWPDEKEALAAVIGALDGLAVIHAQEIVHRDIKPGNIGLRDSEWTDPVILDLGLVRDMLGDSITVYPDLLGTIDFMAPEQLRKEKAVRRSDVFAAGVTLFVLLTGRLPFYEVGEQTVAIEVLEERMRDEDWPKWDEVSDSIEPDVQEVLERMLRPDAFERPRAAAAADALRSILGDR